MTAPLTRSQFKIKLQEAAQRHNVGVNLKLESFSDEMFDIVVLERTKARISHSDHSTGEWRNHNPHSEENKSNE